MKFNKFLSAVCAVVLAVGAANISTFFASADFEYPDDAVFAYGGKSWGRSWDTEHKEQVAFDQLKEVTFYSWDGIWWGFSLPTPSTGYVDRVDTSHTLVVIELKLLDDISEDDELIRYIDTANGTNYNVKADRDYKSGEDIGIEFSYDELWQNVYNETYLAFVDTDANGNEYKAGFGCNLQICVDATMSSYITGYVVDDSVESNPDLDDGSSEIPDDSTVDSKVAKSKPDSYPERTEDYIPVHTAKYYYNSEISMYCLDMQYSESNASRTMGDSPFAGWSISYDLNQRSEITSLVIGKGIDDLSNHPYTIGVFDLFYIESVYISDELTILSDDMFKNCQKLKSINVDENNSYFSSIDGVLYNKEKTTLLCCPAGKDEITIPSSVTKISDGAFFGCTNLKSINVQNNSSHFLSVDNVLYNHDMTELICYPRDKNNVFIPENVKYIGCYSFSGCDKIVNIVIPNNIIKIDTGAFQGCKNLKHVTLPRNVQFGTVNFPGIGYYGINEFYETEDGEAYHSYLTKVKDLTIYGYKNTAAEEYAEENGFDFVALDDETTLDITLNSKDSKLAAQKFTMTVDGEKTIESENASVEIPEMTDGKHTLRFESEHFVAREYEVTVQGGEIIDLPEIELNLIGDINGDGDIKATDLLLDKSHIKGVRALTGYELKCADVDGNGKVNASDLLKMKAHIKGVSKLW